MRQSCSVVLIVLACARPAAAQNPTASFGPSGYAQNFDILRQNQANQTAIPGVLNRVDLAPFTAAAAPNALTGWRWRQSGSSTAFRRDDGLTATGQGYSYGNNFNDNEAALGNLTGSANPGTYFGVVLRNNTGAAVPSVVVSYVGEQWRSGGRGDGSADRLQFGYALASNELPGTAGTTAVPALDFASPVVTGAAGALDGNADANRALVTSTITFGGAGWESGTDLALRWFDVDVALVDDGLAVDNFQIAAPVPEPAAALAVAAVGLAAGRLRRRRA